MKKLTKREKFLINFLIVLILLFVGVRFLVLPAYNENIQKEEESLTLSKTRKQVETLLKDKENTIKTLDEITKEYMNKNSLVIEQSENEKIDLIITSLCMQNSLTPKSLLINEDKESNQEQDTEKKETNVIKRKSVSVITNKDYTALTNLITKINSLNYITIDSFSLKMPQEEVDMDINFSIYMKNQ